VTTDSLSAIQNILALGFSGLIMIIIFLSFHLAEISIELKKIRKLLTSSAINNTHDDKKKGE
jgi:hypothetical protein